VIGAGSTKSILVRAVGPALAAAPFSVTGTLANPRLDLYDSSNKVILSNDDWTTTSVGGSGTFASVGAFSLATGTRDAALLTTLAPGAYTAVVSGVNNTSGIALVEVYDVTGTARLMNLSTRAQVSTGSGIMIAGLVVAPSSGHRQILVRAAGPALGAFGVPGTLADPAIAIVDGTNTQIAANDNWSDASATAMSVAFTKSGAFPFAANSKDAALITDLAPGNYSIQVSGVGNTTGVALVEVYDITPDNLASVIVSATNSTTDTKGGAPGVYTFTRTGPTTSPLTVYYNVSGSAAPGIDYTALPGTVVIPAGASSTTVNLSPRTDGASDTISRTATVSLTNGDGYSLGSANVASVTIFYNPGTNYISSLRAPATAPNAIAYGTASIQLSGDNTFAIVNVNFSNLSSPETAVYLRLGAGGLGQPGDYLFQLPPGQVSGARWNIQAVGTLSAAQVVQALKNGQIYLDIQTSSNPTGELQGTFIQNTATLAFSPPPAPPVLADAALTPADASRFLAQATFGPTKAEIDSLTGKHQSDLNAWITAQMALPASLHLDATRNDFNTFTATGDNPQYSQTNRQSAWFKVVVNGPDQLRQRVAFALSELFVVSDVNSTLANNAQGMANYYDQLVNGAFGNYRTVLENVSLSPVMGIYLSSLRNAKATFATNGALLTSPDENYGREIMQLFSIGLNQLQPDGSLKLDPSGLPIPTYDNTTITQMARVFTGWAFLSGDATSATNFRSSASDYLHPMMLYPAFHEDGAKTIFNGIQIPPNQGGAADLKQTLDALFNHANTAPAISRQLIQRLVTSNPSPGYVYRVAQVFANNGSGVRGDLGAVVRAILMDYEARSTAVAATASFGKLREPLIRATQILRAYGAAANTGRFAISNPEANLLEAALRAPTVFNFFEPTFVQPGTIAAAGLYAPEFEILNDSTAISVPNQLWTYIYSNRSGAFGGATTVNPTETTIGFSWDNSMLALARTPQALVDQFNLVLAGGALSKSITDRIVTAITALPGSTTATYTTNDLERVRSAFYLTVTVPQGATQK
jgi:uncharacterized protein (DUF1800 family)